MKGFFQRLKNIDVFNKKIFSVLYSAAVVCIMIIGIAQVGLKNESTRNFFTKIDYYEGNYFEVAAPVETEAVHIVTIEADGDDFESAKVLLNGKEHSELVPGDNRIEVSRNTVIEIYSPESKVNVRLKDITDGIVVYTEPQEITVEKQLKMFARVGIK